MAIHESAENYLETILMLSKERTFNVVKVSKDQPQPFDLKAKGTTVKYAGKAQTIKL